MPQPGRGFSQNGSKSYRFGYQGSEKDDDINGKGNYFTTEFREGDTRLMRWWSTDPESDAQPWQSPYSYMDGNPIANNDTKGDCVICDFGSGVVDGVIDGVEGTIGAVKTVVMHPVQTAKGIASAVYNYNQTYQAIKGAVGDAYNTAATGNAYQRGHLAGQVLEAVGEAFIGAELVKVGTTALRAGSTAMKVVEAEEVAVKAEGIIYRRTNPKTLKEYIGKAKSEAHFEARQNVHNSKLGVKHKYKIIDRAQPGEALSLAEETHIRKGGGPQRKGGSLENKRYEMNEKRYKTAGGKTPKPTK